VKVFRNFHINIAAQLLLSLFQSSERNSKMKTINASLPLPLLTLIFSFALSGCYTQLAFVDDENDSAYKPAQTIMYQPEVITVYVPVPYDPLPFPVYTPTPTAGSTSTITQPQSPPQIRDFGHQRSGQSDNTQTTSADSDKRTSGTTRGGR
jgi:hypothetical protein